MVSPRSSRITFAAVATVATALVLSHLATHAVSDEALPVVNGGVVELPSAPKATIASTRPREGWLLDASPHDIASRKALFEKLERTISFQVEHQPLREVVNKLAEDLRIKITFEEKLKVGTSKDSLDSPVTITAENESAESVLSRLLDQGDLTWYPRGDAIVVNTWEAPESTQVIAYDVTDLVVDDEGEADFTMLSLIVQRVIYPRSWRYDNGLGTVTPFVRGRTALVFIRHAAQVQRRVANLFATLRETGLSREPSASISKFTLVPLPDRHTAGQQ